jgi:hypothetical protein
VTFDGKQHILKTKSPKRGAL